MNTADTALNRIRLAELAKTVARLREQYDVLMNAFKFDEARALAPAIEAAERERTTLAASLPPDEALEPKPYAIARRRRRR